MRVVVMNNIEVDYYKDCKDPAFLNFVGYRNELSMISMILALLNTRMIALTSSPITNKNLSSCEKYALMYRKGQVDILNKTINMIDEMKHNLIQKMYQDQTKHRLAPCAPFLSIVHTTLYNKQLAMDEDHSPFITLDKVAITLDTLLKKDSAFANVIYENFEDLEEEGDIIMMLSLIREYSTNPNSQWMQFFDKVKNSNISAPSDQLAELKEMYDSIIPAFSEAYPEIFDLNAYTLESFIWADHILNNYSIGNPFAIIPL
ncbi:MAG: hypothetical protein EXX96DRAFT_354937 [Benjaminiella poitrasii]|nr:MAG: hypothetical protein EXX96DRAFT_354937 [Benjaminiella poitrasii]